jgi:hypothetical protein
LIIGAIVLLLSYALNWYEVYRQHNLNTAIISKYITEVTREEFQTYIQENPTAFVYIGIIDDVNSRNFESGFKKTVIKYHLKDNIIYLNAKDFDYKVLLGDYEKEKEYVFEVPMIIYFENKKILSLINSSNSNMFEKDIIRFFRKYGEIE